MVKPFDIHIMKKERGCNTFEGKLLDTIMWNFWDVTSNVSGRRNRSNEDVKVEVDFDKVVLQDNEGGRYIDQVK